MKPRSDVDTSMGMLFGLAIGDALGRPTEFMSLTNIYSKYGPEGIRDLPEQALYTELRGANTHGDSDSVACIAGGISGAYLGFKAIPPEWAKKIEKTDYLNDLAHRLSMKKEALNPLLIPL